MALDSPSSDPTALDAERPGLQPGTSWPTNTAEARAVQEALRGRVRTVAEVDEVRSIAGVDAHLQATAGLVWAAVVVVDARSLELRASALACRPLNFPYVPGLLSFREAPAVLAALAMLEEMPDLVMIDGQGIAHPRRFGIAAHVGVLIDRPTIGVAKSRLVGEHKEPGAAVGSTVPLHHKGETIGAVLRSRHATRPLFVSIGHRVDLVSAVQWTRACIRRHRLPEPTRLADKLSRAHPA